MNPGIEERTESYWSRVGTCVTAAAGDAEALAQVVASARLNGLASALRLGPALALAAEKLAVKPSGEWRHDLQSAMTSWLVVDRAAAVVSEALADAGVQWAPIKGFDVGTRFYQPRERRPTSDLDILIGHADLPAARRALASAGWTDLETGRRWERYLAEEGYAWQATGAPGALLEAHFRLWGLVPEGLELEALAESQPDPTLGACGRRLKPEYAFVLAAVHGWMQALPRSPNDWHDLERISHCEPADLATAVVSIARRWSLQLPVALSAWVVDRLWSNGVCADIVAVLEPELTRSEGRLLGRLGRQGVDAIAWRQIVLARLIAGRASRAGWRTVWRQLWAHPGEVERVTSDAWSWPRRRLHHLAGSVMRRQG